jgi:O-antigen/teichoic acid export membrane protein
VDSGLGQALMRQQEISDEDRATVFWTNLLISLLIVVLLFIAAPQIELFFNAAGLGKLLRIMSLTIVFNALSVVQKAELSHQLNFKLQATAQVPAVLFSGILAYLLATMGYGYWALVAFALSSSLLNSSLLWLLSPRKLLLVWSSSSFKHLFGFGSRLMLSGLLDTFFQQLYRLVIGKYFEAKTLGYFVQSQNLQQMVGQNIATVINRVTLPLLSKVKDDKHQLKTIYRQILILSSTVIFPAMLLLLVFAEPIVWHVLGKQWLPSVPYLQLLTATGMLYHLHAINLNVLLVLGRSDLFLRLEIIKKINIVIGIVVGFPFGVEGLLWASLVTSVVALFINAYYTVVFLSYSMGEQVKDIFIVFLKTCPMLFLAWLLAHYHQPSNLGWLILYLMVCFLSYIFYNFMFDKRLKAYIGSLGFSLKGNLNTEDISYD